MKRTSPANSRGSSRLPWIPPEVEFVNFNVDGATSRQGSRGYVTAVCRDHLVFNWARRRQLLLTTSMKLAALKLLLYQKLNLWLWMSMKVVAAGTGQ